MLRGPRNIACLSNTKVIITCEVSGNDSFYIDWSHANRNTSLPQRLFKTTGDNVHVSPSVMMIKTANGESLVLDSVRLRDAGVYYCIMTHTTIGISKEVGGHVIILGECELLFLQC